MHPPLPCIKATYFQSHISSLISTNNFSDSLTEIYQQLKLPFNIKLIRQLVIKNVCVNYSIKKLYKIQVLIWRRRSSAFNCEPTVKRVYWIQSKVWPTEWSTRDNELSLCWQIVLTYVSIDINSGQCNTKVGNSVHKKVNKMDHSSEQ